MANTTKIGGRMARLVDESGEAWSHGIRRGHR
jgi:hypothetical protein